jgi:oligopeptide transport system substrate-binding protein
MRRRAFIGVAAALATRAPPLRAASGSPVLRRIVPSEITTLDPQRPTGQLTSELGPELFSGLTTFDASGQVAPGIAARWRTNDRFDEYVFELRAGLKWSDGRALTASDVVYSIRRFLTPAVAAQQASRLDALANGREARLGKIAPEKIGVTASSETVVRFQLTEPDIEFPSMLALAYVVPPHAIQAHGQAWARPEFIVSNGPYKLQRWSPGAKTVRLARNPHFHAIGSVAVERVEWHTGFDDPTRLGMFRAGQGDVVTIEDSTALALARRDFPGQLRSSAKFSIGQIGLNLRRPALQNTDVRRALALAIDRRLLVDRVRSLGEQVSESFLPAGLPHYSTRGAPPHAGLPMPQRLELARSLMQRAGYGGTKRLPLSIGYPTSATGRKVYLAVAQMWKSLGVDVELQPIEGRAYNAAIQRGEFDVLSFNTFALVPSALVFFERFLSDSALNVCFYRSAEFDRLFNEGRRAIDLTTRSAKLLAAERVLLRDYPAIPLYTGAAHRLIAAPIRGWVDHGALANPSQYLSFAD